MSYMKRFAEQVSVDMGLDGEITDEVLTEAQKRLKGTNMSDKVYVEANLTVLVPVTVRASFLLRDPESDPTNCIERFLKGDDQPGEIEFRSLDLIQRIGNTEIQRAEPLDAFSTINPEDVEEAIRDHIESTAEPVTTHVWDVEVIDAK